MRRKIYIIGIFLALFSCTEEIDKSNRYTFTGETVADYLQNRSDKYSHFISLLERANLLGLLSTYGQYTLFLPNNDAVEKYIQEKDSIYWATKDTDAPVWTGVTSPLVKELSDSMINVIARTHLIEGNYQTAKFDDGALPSWNFNDRYLGVSYEGTEESFHIKINSCAAIIGSDNMVENGVVHIVDNVIEETNNYLPTHIAKYSFFSLFSEALKETHFGDSLLQYMDVHYQPLNIEDCPQKRYYKYTGFIETDEVFNANGIFTLADLKVFAEKWYGTEDREDCTSPSNALYKFIAYHFLPRELTYNKVIPLQISYLTLNYPLAELIAPGHDCYDYFETMMGKLMKVVKPLGSTDGAWVYINRPKEGKVYNNEMRRHLNVRLIEPTEFTQSREEYSRFNPIAMNGVIQPIDKILVYDEDEMAGNILNERMRFDFGTLLPELSGNNIRYTTFQSNIPFAYCKNIKNNSNHSTHLSYELNSWNYMADQFYQTDLFDISFRLPPVPQKTYEIRLSINIINFEDKRLWPGVLQPYIDGKVCSLPIDLTVNNNSLTWVDDADTQDNGIEFDKYLRSIGFMKGPDSYNIYGKFEMVPARTINNYFRRIIAKAHLTEGEHWIRLKLLSQGAEIKNVFSLDYIELVPLHIINDPTKPEDRH
ncbi:MAG: fasciclin domain-containing protein [Bacteroidaceae bacterium]|nr:fasciclin domain-containing protein [Bacteroidaceae bacterium]